MPGQRFISFLIASAFVLAGPAPWLAPLSQAADTNGDSQVDILDLQQAVAELLRPDGDTKLADVNGDGAVDILDVQRILNQASETAPPEPEDEQPPASPAVPPTLTAQPWPADFVPAILALVIPAAPAAPLPVVALTAPPPSEFRLVFGLSPHAPPTRGAEQPQCCAGGNLHSLRA